MSGNDHAVPATPVRPQKKTLDEVGFNIVFYRLLCVEAAKKLEAENRITERLKAKFFYEVGVCSNILENLFEWAPSHIARQEAVVRANAEIFAADLEEFCNSVAPGEKKILVTDNLGNEFNALRAAHGFAAGARRVKL